MGGGAEALVEALGEVEKLKVRLSARLSAPAGPRSVENDRLVKVDEAAEALGMSKSELYKTADDYPFTLRIGRLLRFSQRGIDTWIARRTRP
jgi:predicted DNA-binding transcriptional regulator AlpA